MSSIPALERAQSMSTLGRPIPPPSFPPLSAAAGSRPAPLAARLTGGPQSRPIAGPLPGRQVLLQQRCALGPWPHSCRGQGA
jgi:hypothetical protein